MDGIFRKQKLLWLKFKTLYIHIYTRTVYKIIRARILNYTRVSYKRIKQYYMLYINFLVVKKFL